MQGEISLSAEMSLRVEIEILFRFDSSLSADSSQFPLPLYVWLALILSVVDMKDREFLWFPLFRPNICGFSPNLTDSVFPTVVVI